MLPAPLNLDYSLVWGVCSLFSVVVYVFYQRFRHPLVVYPGPFWASLTNIWEAIHWMSGDLPYALADLHAKHGAVVRYGPNKLSITSKDAVHAIYVKGAKTLPKTEYYNPFGHPRHPNVFNQRDPESHALRRRILLKAFSPQAVETYEPLIDKHLQRLRSSVRESALTGSPFDLKAAIYLAVCDVNGELFLGEDLHVQESGEPHRLADDHTLAKLGVVSGSWPAIQPILNLIILLFPHPRTWRLKSWRNTLSYFSHVDRCVKQCMQKSDGGHNAERKDILTRVITIGCNNSKSENLLSTEAVVAETFSFVIAGIHPPSAATNLLFWHLLHNPEVMQQVQKEIDTALPPPSDNSIYSAAQVERNLPLLTHCVKESHRVTPIFTQPLPRRVMDPQGILLNGKIVPKDIKTSVAICNYAFHHNPDIWGPQHLEFRPSRWSDPNGYSPETAKLLMHFSAGGRQCIGKVLATTLIYKIVSLLLADFDFELAGPQERERNGLPVQVSVGISDLKHPLMVQAKLRKARSRTFSTE